MKRAVRYFVATAAGSAVCIAVLLAKNVFASHDTAQTVRILADAFTAAGLTLLVSGLLVCIARQGTFFGMGYAFHSLIVALHSNEYRKAHRESYSEYVERKGKKNTAFLFLLITGGVFMIPAVVFTILFFYV